jgi:hypothetical protein
MIGQKRNDNNIQKGYIMYKYESERANLFSEKSQVDFLKIRDNVRYLLSISGAVMMNNAIKVSTSSDTWFKLACVDRLVELGELKEVSEPNCAGQFRVFISPSSRL